MTQPIINDQAVTGRTRVEFTLFALWANQVDGRLGFKRNQLVGTKVVGMLRCAPLRQVLRGGAQQSPVVCQFTSLQITVWKHRVPQCQVKTALDEIKLHIRQPQVQIDARVKLQKIRHQR